MIDPTVDLETEMAIIAEKLMESTGASAFADMTASSFAHCANERANIKYEISLVYRKFAISFGGKKTFEEIKAQADRIEILFRRF